jgi:hypothetical protein
MSRIGIGFMLLVTAGALAAGPLAGQGRGTKPKHYSVSHDRAFTVTKDVLGRHGFEVVRIEIKGGDRIVYYRRGNMGRGKGKGPMQTLIIRRVENRIVFVDVPDVVLVDIDIRLRL